MPKLIFQEEKLSSDRLKRKLKGKELDWYQRDLQLEVKRAYRDAWHLRSLKGACSVCMSPLLCFTDHRFESCEGLSINFFFLSFLSRAIDMTT